MQTYQEVIQRWGRLAFLFALNTQLIIAHAGAMILPGNTNPTSTPPQDEVGAKAGVDYQGGGLGVTPSLGGARLYCIFQGLEGEATTGGLWLTSTVTNQVSDRFQVKAAWLGRRGAVAPLADQGTVSVAQQTVCFERAELVEEFAVSMDGVRQDFLVTGKPAGTAELVLGLALTGARVEATAYGAQLLLNHSGRKIAYSRLCVTDATGKKLPARMEVAARTSVRAENPGLALSVVVNDAGAVYPVRIDPAFSDANWVGGWSGTDGTVDVTAVDGQGNLYIGGAFDAVGNTAAYFVAKWDGSTWSSLGLGMDNGVEAFAFSPDGSVYASGAFLTATNDDGTAVNVNGIAEWDGSQWWPLGDGVTGGVYGFFYVDALAVSGTNLYAGGYFSSMGGVPASYIAQWNGSEWSSLGSGLDGVLYANVTTLTFFGGNLYAGGGFSTAGGISTPYIAEWNGSSWLPVGAGLDYGVNALVVSGTNLYVGGNFNTAYNSDGDAVTAHYVAQWDGNEWSAIGTGMNNTVDSLAVWGNTLYAGGIFKTAGGATVNNIAQWDGSTWSAMGSGTSGYGGAGDVRTLATSGGILYAGGNFTTAGGVTVNHIAAAVLEGPGFRGGPVGNTDGSISLKAMSLTTSTNRLYATSNLIPPIVWQPIYTNFTGGFWLFTDTNIATFSSKFYRLSMP